MTAIVWESCVLPHPGSRQHTRMAPHRRRLTELAIHLADTAGLEAFVEDRVPLLAAGRDAEAALSNV